MINYTKTLWKDGDTVITADSMNNIEEGIEAIANELNKGGNVGPEGPAGPKGDTGADGVAATIDVGTVTTGEAGTEAKIENTGTTNAAVLNFVIPRGADGANGAKGDKGDKGDPGEAGPKGDAGADGVDGANGLSITSIELTADVDGAITGGSATMSDGSTVAITVTKS